MNINKLGINFPTAKCKELFTSFKKKIQNLPSQLSKDTFERSSKKAGDENTLEHLKIKVKKIELSPDDVEKMKSMTREDRLNYLQSLKQDGLYRCVEEQ